jgi:hypothetical protein
VKIAPFLFIYGLETEAVLFPFLPVFKLVWVLKLKQKISIYYTMKRYFFPLFLVLLVASGFVFSGFESRDTMRNIDNDSFTSGEKLDYIVHYGLINAAQATIDIDNDIQMINNRPCYKVNVFGKTTGSFDFFLRVRDTWRSYIDTTSIVPQRFHRNIEEGKYKKKENIMFDHYKNLATVEDKKATNTYKVPDNVQDIVSGVYYLRTLDYDRRKMNETIKIQGFFDEEVFDFTVTYKGRDVVETKAGDIKVIKLVPKMPKNKLFDGEDAITVYLSDDKNKIPVLIQAEMFVGSVKIDLYKYKGLKSRLNIASN